MKTHKLSILLILMFAGGILSACDDAAYISSDPNVSGVQARATLEFVQAVQTSTAQALYAAEWQATVQAGATQDAIQAAYVAAQATEESIRSAAAATQTQQVWNATATADSSQATATAAANATAVSWSSTATQSAWNNQATAEVASVQALQTAQAAQADMARMAAERQRTINKIQAAAPWVILAIAVPLVEYLAWIWGNTEALHRRAIPRDRRGDAPILILDDHGWRNVMEGYPESLDEYNRIITRHGGDPLPRLLVVLDEFSTLMTTLGGPKSSFANRVAELGWRGRKLGVHLVFAAQDFTKQVVGRVRDQVNAAICFRVRSLEAARAMGCPEAVRIPESRPGLACTDRWGLVQTFYLDKHIFGQISSRAVLNRQKQELVERALNKAEGKMSIPLLVSWGMPERGARSLVERWELRGWLRQDPARQNARFITPKLLEILSNSQSGQTASSESSW